MKLCLLLFAVLSLGEFMSAFPQSEPQFRIALKISGDAAVAGEIESCIKKELSGLKNVEISDVKPDYTIDVIAMEIATKEKTPVGLALTWLALYHPKGFFESCNLIEDYRLLTVDQDDLQSNCQRLVERFNTKSLEPHRKIFERAKP